MKLLIAGLPKSGKSTLIKSLVLRYGNGAQGFITSEIKDGDIRIFSHSDLRSVNDISPEFLASTNTGLSPSDSSE